MAEDRGDEQEVLVRLTEQETIMMNTATGLLEHAKVILGLIWKPLMKKYDLPGICNVHPVTGEVTAFIPEAEVVPEEELTDG